MSAPDLALVGPYPAPGHLHDGWTGVASYTANLAGALADAGAEVHVVAPREPGVPARHHDGRVLVERAFARGRRALPAAASAARATGAPVVHIQHETFLYGGPDHVPGLVTGLARLRGRRQRTVVTMHHVVDPATVDRAFVEMHGVRVPVAAVRAGLNGVSIAIRRLADSVIVHEPAFASTLSRAEVVAHGIELRDPVTRDPARRAARGIDPDRLAVLAFGFVAPYKGLEGLLSAGRLARDEVQIVVAGGPHPRLAASGDDYFERLRAAHGDDAPFVGYVPDDEVPGLFADVDLAVFPYPRPVSSSGALALALAHRTPVLVSPALSRTMGAPEALIAPTDPVDLAARLTALATDDAALADLAGTSRGLAAGRSWSAVARRHLEIYAKGSLR